MQYSAVQNCKATLLEGECMIQMDFAENYTCIPLEEVQSGYWNQDQVTLHPTVVYYRQDGTMKHHNFVAISDDRGHNTATIKAIINSIIPRVQQLIPGLKQIHYWTDSPTAQYRNKTIFNLISSHHLLYKGIHATWNYFESGHGKGPCDGIGGTVKRLADDAVKRGVASIQDAHDFYAWACQEREESSIEYLFVSREDCARSAEFIQQWSTSKPVSGTMKIHSVIGVDKNQILIRDISCYCDNCRSCHLPDMCSGWELRRLSRRPAQVDKTPVAEADTELEPANDSLPTTSSASNEISSEPVEKGVYMFPR